MACCRQTIAEQIVNFKARAFGANDVVPSAISGKLLKRDECHVDHVSPTFRALVGQFIDNEHLNPSQVGILHSTTCATLSFIDKALERRWQDFHWKNASLQVVSREENMQKNKKERQHG